MYGKSVLYEKRRLAHFSFDMLSKGAGLVALTRPWSVRVFCLVTDTQPLNKLVKSQADGHGAFRLHDDGYRRTLQGVWPTHTLLSCQRVVCLSVCTAPGPSQLSLFSCLLFLLQLVPVLSRLLQSLPFYPCLKHLGQEVVKKESSFFFL